jgi:hypothetical protein
MSAGHIYRAPLQPATRFRDLSLGRRYFRWPARLLLWCDSCETRHRAENMQVAVYYDCLRCFCAPGKGCKSK